MQGIKSILNIYRKPHIFAIMCLSFSCGFPFLLLSSSLPYWLKELNYPLEWIGYFSLLTFPYSIKFLIAPFMEKKPVYYLTAKLGQRRSWALVAQACLSIAILGLAYSEPEKHVFLIAVCTALVALFASMQDIALDAYRIEKLSKEELGIGTAASGMGFRLGMLFSSAGAMYLSSVYSWPKVFTIAAVISLIGPITILLVTEPEHKKADSKLHALYGTNDSGFIAYCMNVVKSFTSITRHENWQYIILFILLFKIGDSIPNYMSGLLCHDLGFSKDQVGNAKTIGLVMMILGSFVGGVVISRTSIMKSVLIGGSLQILSPAIFYVFSIVGYDENMILISHGIQSFCCGLGATAFVTYLSSLCTGGFTAIQFAVIYSFSSMSRSILVSVSGKAKVVLGLDWSEFFILVSALSILFIMPVLKLSRTAVKPKLEVEAA